MIFGCPAVHILSVRLSTRRRQCRSVTTSMIRPYAPQETPNQFFAEATQDSAVHLLVVYCTVCTYETWAGIHKACLHKKTDLKTNSFQTLFINAFLVVYLTFYRTDLSTIIFLMQNGVFFPKYSVIMHRKLKTEVCLSWSANAKR